MKKQTENKEAKLQPKTPHARPRLIEHGSVVDLTLNTTEGTDPEGYIDNVVWGN